MKNGVTTSPAARRLLRARAVVAGGFDTSTAFGRSRERYRRVLLTAVASGAARGASILSILVTVPLAVGYLGEERYGLLMMVTSVLALLVFADLGMASGLVNAISEASGRDDEDAARRYTSTAFFMLVALAGALGLAFAAAYPWVPWEGVFNVSSPQARSEAGPAIAVLVACFLVGMPLAVVERVQMGYQEGFLNGLWLAAATLLALAGIVVAIALEASLPVLVLLIAGALPLSLVVNGIVLFARRRPVLRPQWTQVRRDAAAHLLRLGFLFFILQVGVAVAYSSDAIVAGQVLGPEAVTEYSVTFRMFTVLTLVLMLVLLPLWPAYGEALARGEIDWARRTLVRTLAIAAGVTIAASALLVVFGARLLHVWVGPEISPSLGLLVGMGAWQVVLGCGNTVAMFLNAANIVRFQVVSAILMATAALAGKIFLAGEIGLAGIVWATVAANVAFFAVPVAFFLPRVFRSLERRAAAPAPDVQRAPLGTEGLA